MKPLSGDSSGAGHPDRVNGVLLAAVIEDSTIVSVLKGWLPEGMVLPPEILAPGWKMNDLLDQFGRNLLTGIMTVDGKRVFAAMDLDLNELNVAGTPDILPILSTSTGSVVWTGSEENTSGLASHIRARGLVARKASAEGAWSLLRSHYGERVVLRQEPFLYGLRLSLVYPLSSLVRSAMYGAAFPARPRWQHCWPFSSSGSSGGGGFTAASGASRPWPRI